ncbi:Hypothetical protein CINCED_3A023307 [Cinara cedri]|uniref:Olfactory receptor, insect n=1 Tax=Cinara cedri TaxID=506608 RepID=A0A5E4MLM2_9HEMI|nr:Hypothetical protein CINCED_3A023307 [Cinara cedri]
MKWKDGYDERNTMLNVKLSKTIGLYQILDPKSPRTFGYNVYHVIATVLLAYEMVVLSLSLTGIYYWISNLSYMAPQIGYSTNVLCTCYKIWLLIQHPGRLRSCIEVACIDFMATGRFGAALFRRTRAKTIRVTRAYVMMGFLILSMYIVTPLVFNDNYLLLKGPDGVRHQYHLSVFNVFFPVTSAAYNRFFMLFHVFEIVFGYVWVVYSHVFDLFVVTMCYAISCQLNTIGVVFATLGQKMADYRGECKTTITRVHNDRETTGCRGSTLCIKRNLFCP